ncbi:MAG: hypothetical protein KDE51_12175, partial [Anaerolineales bacterium]|nr:hypothetical protein [Anaerolineales bacterium]
EPNKGYWLYATADITAYFGVAGLNTTLHVANQVLPQATYYGYVRPNDGFQPTAGMIVTAWVDGVYCGQGVLQMLDGQLAYIIQIQAENRMGDCGTAGKLVTFQINGRTMAQQPEWDHSQAQFVDLSTLAKTRPVYLPVITRP